MFRAITKHLRPNKGFEISSVTETLKRYNSTNVIKPLEGIRVLELGQVGIL